MAAIERINPFSTFIDLEKTDLESLTVKENNSKDNCYIHYEGGIVGGFILINGPQVKTICNVTFYKSNVDSRYLPRLEFRKESSKGEIKLAKNDVIINFGTGDDARVFWKLMHFLNGFKELVDLGDFHSKYQAVSFESYSVSFNSKHQAEKIKELSELISKTKLSNQDLKDIIFSHRKTCLHWFYALLKDLSNTKGENVYYSYRNKHNIKEVGEEAIWHHFLKENDWIIGLNIDIKFIRDLLSEQKVGIENSKGKGSPKVDFLGISYFTSLIELKTTKTLIFKSEKTSKSRANTWDFSNDFIEAYSQTLAQRTELDEGKEIIDDNGNVLDTKINRILDPKSILIIGLRNAEFPHKRNSDFNLKTDCFERFRRDIRNVEIITYDELFERAFHIVYTEKLPYDWFLKDHKDFINNVLKLN